MKTNGYYKEISTATAQRNVSCSQIPSMKQRFGVVAYIVITRTQRGIHIARLSICYGSPILPQSHVSSEACITLKYHTNTSIHEPRVIQAALIYTTMEYSTKWWKQFFYTSAEAASAIEDTSQKIKLDLLYLWFFDRNLFYLYW